MGKQSRDMSISPKSAIICETWDNINLSEPQFHNEISLTLKSYDLHILVDD